MVGALALIFQAGGGGEGHGEDFGETAIGGLHGANGVDEGGEAVPGVGVAEGGGDGGNVGVHGAGEDRVDEVFAGGEAPEEGGDADAGGAGDAGHGRLNAVGGKDAAGGGDDPLAVALGVPAQRVPVRRCGGLAVGRVVSGGHGLIVTRNWNTLSVSVATLGGRKRIDLSD